MDQIKILFGGYRVKIVKFNKKYAKWHYLRLFSNKINRAFYFYENATDLQLPLQFMLPYMWLELLTLLSIGINEFKISKTII